MLVVWSVLVVCSLTESSVVKLKLTLNIVHNISVVKQMCEVEVSSPDAWAWRKRLRLYVNNDKRCSIQMVDTHFSYTFE